MTDAELVAKRVAVISTRCREIRTRAHLDRIHDDVRELRFLEHTLQVAIQAVLDVASPIVSDERLGEPETNRDLFVRLERAGWLDGELSRALQRMAGFPVVQVASTSVTRAILVARVRTASATGARALVASRIHDAGELERLGDASAPVPLPLAA